VKLKKFTSLKNSTLLIVTLNSTPLIITLNKSNTQSFVRWQWLLSFSRYSQEFYGTETTCNTVYYIP